MLRARETARGAAGPNTAARIVVDPDENLQEPSERERQETSAARGRKVAFDVRPSGLVILIGDESCIILFEIRSGCL